MRRVCFLWSLAFLFLCACLAAGLPGRALAAYPERTITMIIPFGAGGATDVIGRYIALHLGKRLGQTIIVKNIAGSGGVIGMTELAKSRPDGYTIGFSPVAPLIMQPNFRKTMYDLSSFCSIARATNEPLFLEVSAQSPIKDMKDLKNAVQAAPDKFFWGHLGMGSQIHLSMAHMFKLMGVNPRAIVFKDDAEAMAALISGRIMLYDSLPSLPARYGVRAIASLSEERYPQLNVPTSLEQGYDLRYTQWMSLIGPKGISPECIAVLERAFADVCNDPEYIKDIASVHSVPAFLNSKDNQAFMEKEEAYYKRAMNDILKTQ